MFYEIEVAIGHCHSNGMTLPAHQVAAVVNEGLLALTRIFRGAYSQAGIGGYLNKEDFPFTEPTTIFKVYTMNVDSLMPYLEILAGELAAALHQECVMLLTKRVEGTLQFVKPISYSSTKFLLLEQQEPVRLPTNNEESVVVPFNITVHGPASS